ncbi:TPA: acyltransferase [Vibrio harveyi]|nr:acyltransferase [Vibrio harveyi]HDM8180702.1 acyltransferase [Vibrio harveyi]
MQELPQKKERGKINFNNLTVLRGFLALYVLFGHSREIFFIGGSYLTSVKELAWYDYFLLLTFQYTILGKEAVTLFFVLSGFSIAYSLSRSDKVGSFYFKRFIRIYPTYLLSVILIYVVIGVVKSNDLKDYYISSDTLLSLLLYLEYKGELSIPYWSLVYEVIFYLIAPALILIKPKVLLFFSSVLYILGLFMYGASFRSAGGIFQNFIFEYMFYFSIGIYLYENYLSYVDKISTKINLIYELFIAATLLIVLNKLGVEKKITMLITALASLYLIPKFERFSFNIGSYQKYIYESSYSIYVFHYPILISILYLSGDVIRRESYFTWIWVAAVASVFCVLLWCVCERNINNYLSKRRIKQC